MWAQKRFRGLAACALDEATSFARAQLDNYGCEPFSVDYQLGFIDGFVDFLEAGGTGNPSPLPPRRYWKAKYQNPVGYQCTQDWFLGFQHGARAAQSSNYRLFVTVPLSDSVTADALPYPYGRISAVEQTEGPNEGDEPHESDATDYADRKNVRSMDTATRTNSDSSQITRLPEVSETQ